MSQLIDDQPSVTGRYVDLDGDRYYRIGDVQRMPEFFMSLVGPSDHWMFVSSRGALTAGRRDPDASLFPYAPDDQISAMRGITGPLTLIHTSHDKAAWRPFSFQTDSSERCHNHLYKTPLGNKVVFEETNEVRELAFRYRWAFSEQFGFVRSCRLENLSSGQQTIQLLDGIQNLIPYGVGSEFSARYSNLANAYKKSELLEPSQIGLFYLSSIPTDRAEPSEGLKATIAWQHGLTPDAVLLSTEQLATFETGGLVATETDVRGRPGAYLVTQSITLEPGESIQWHIVSDVEKDHSDLVQLQTRLCPGDAQVSPSIENLSQTIADDVSQCEQDLTRIVASADGLQRTANQPRTDRHLANTVFNVMRGGVPVDNYCVDKKDFRRHLENFNRRIAKTHSAWIDQLPSPLSTTQLREAARATGDRDLFRLATEYLPLAFSRRHGDPTRPWNRFAIELRRPDGSTNLHYQGNWRDIFQNWEALAVSFPDLTTAMVCRFVNATTADGYNPYRLTKDGFEWEAPSPEDPWANIGYWGDHQIIYLLKLIEWHRRVDPAALDTLLCERSFVHADVPYRIRDFEAIRSNPHDTIEFDAEHAADVAQRVESIGSDGKLVRNSNGEIHYVNLVEKLLTLSLAKLTNFVPGGGIWLNTQRPEWNDANNALVGNGLSMVTACYLYRWFQYMHDWWSRIADDEIRLSREVAEWLQSIHEALAWHADSLDQIDPNNGGDAPQWRARVTESLSRAGSDFRRQLYERGPSGRSSEISRSDLLSLCELASRFLDHSIRGNRRPDGLYHAYNLLRWDDDGIRIDRLDPMLEGQVAVLSAGLLSTREVVELLDALRHSPLYRDDQQSYLLYPDRQLPRFMDKNLVPADSINQIPLLRRLVEAGNTDIVRQDSRGDVHFNGAFRNASDLRQTLDRLPAKYRNGSTGDDEAIVTLFENVFHHHRFTGRSGTFFAYEGLGSIYWHMVSKLRLAIAENIIKATANQEREDLIDALRLHYRDVVSGIGAEKTPQEYGAFPFDPYSHTPSRAGVKQPGMTGQVKEDILARFLEMGVRVDDGRVRFAFDLFDDEERLTAMADFDYCDVHGAFHVIDVTQHGVAFTLCQVPIVYGVGDADEINVRYADGQQRKIDGLQMDETTSRELFSRSGRIDRIECRVKLRQ